MVNIHRYKCKETRFTLNSSSPVRGKITVGVQHEMLLTFKKQ